jgi:hypothetical protein
MEIRMWTENVTGFAQVKLVSGAYLVGAEYTVKFSQGLLLVLRDSDSTCQQVTAGARIAVTLDGSDQPAPDSGCSVSPPFLGCGLPLASCCCPRTCPRCHAAPWDNTVNKSETDGGRRSQSGRSHLGSKINQKQYGIVASNLHRSNLF